MKELPIQSARLNIKYLLISQMIFTSVLVLLTSHWTIQSAYSTLLGGMICMFGTLIFTVLFFRTHVNAKKIVRSFYWAEVVKIISTIALISLAVHTLHVQPFSLLLGYICAQSAFWMTPWLFRPHKKKRFNYA